MELFRTNKDGKPALELVVRNATYSPELDAITLALGIVPTADVANRRGLICANAAELDAARDQIKKFFDAKGLWKI